MKKLFLVIAFSFTLTFVNNITAQQAVQLSDIDLVNLGDGQLQGQNRGVEKTPINGKVRIITGFTTEYVDAEFTNGIAIGKWEYYKDNKLSQVTNYDNGYESGEKIAYHADGKTLRSKTPLLKGKVEGTAVRYDSDGKKEYEKGMKDGLDEGPERTYDKDGAITSEIIFKNGKAEGKSFATINKGYDDCYTKTEFYKGGQLDGVYKEEFCDGKPKISGKYIAGKKDGLWEYQKKDGARYKPTEGYSNGDLVKKITYYTNGNVDTERNYKNGKEEGVVKQYTQDGTLKSEKNYVGGKQVGKQMQYYSSSTHDYTEISNYSADGKKNGEYLETFAETKSVKIKGEYLNGQKSGKWTTSDPKGTSVREEDFSNGKLTGSKKTEKHAQMERYPAYTSVTLFDADGYKTGEYTETYDASKKVKQKGQYVKNRKDGKWLFYDESGKQTKEEIYENGVEKSSKKI